MHPAIVGRPLHQNGYRGYLRTWIIPRWGRYTLNSIRAGEIELWLRSLPLARTSCAKIRNVMSVLFNHGLRHELVNRNPVQWVRQSAKQKKIPAVLEIEEVISLLGALDMRERTMVLHDVVTGQANCWDSSGPTSTSKTTRSASRAPSLCKLSAQARRRRRRSRFHSTRFSRERSTPGGFTRNTKPQATGSASKTAKTAPMSRPSTQADLCEMQSRVVRCT